MACLKVLGLMLMEGFSLNADNRWRKRDKKILANLSGALG